MRNGPSIGSYLAAKKHRQTDPNCGDYMISCEETCGEVHVGHSRDIPRRLEQHAASVHRDSLSGYSVGKHVRGTGHSMNTDQQLVVYKSKSKPHRLVVKSCLMKVSNTIPHNTSSSFSKDIDLLAPMVVKGAPLDWEIISKAQPSFNQRVVPKKYKKFFSRNIVDAAASDDSNTQANPSGQPDAATRRHTRSQVMRSELPDAE